MASSSPFLFTAASASSTQTNFLPNVLSIKLNDFNFFNWKQQIINEIKSFGLIHHLSKETIVPPENSPEKMEYNKQDYYLLVLITGSQPLSSSLLHLPHNIRTVADLWTAIEEWFFQTFSSPSDLNYSSGRGHSINDYDQAVTQIAGSGEKALKCPLVNSPSNKGKSEDSASVTAAAAGRKAPERPCDDRVKAYIEWRAQVKGGSSRKPPPNEEVDWVLVGGKLTTRPSRFVGYPPRTGQAKPRELPGVYYPEGGPSYPAPGSRRRGLRKNNADGSCF